MELKLDKLVKIEKKENQDFKGWTYSKRGNIGGSRKPEFWN